MKQGDFTNLAKQYHFRPNYCRTLLASILLRVMDAHREPIVVADVGAGTGKLSQDLLALQLECIAIEPNSEMRSEGSANVVDQKITWKEGSAELTGLPPASVHWVTMGSSFHWTDTNAALTEFGRILKPKGFFTAIWNPRDIERSEFHTSIENKIRAIVPELQRRSSGKSDFTEELDLTLTKERLFKDCIFSETRYSLTTSRDAYLGAWDSVNDIQAQAGPTRWEEIRTMLREETEGMVEIEVPYRSRSWTVQRVD